MKVLFLALPSSLSVQNIATRSELMLNHVKNRDEVFVLKCGGEQPYCYSNFLKNKSICLKCNLLCDSSLDILNIPNKNIFYLNKDISFQDIPKKFRNIKELKEFNIEGINLGFGVASYMISLLREINFDTIEQKDTIYSICKSAVLIYESTLNLLKKIKPDLVYIWNGRFFDSWAALSACKSLGISFRLFESINGFKYNEKKQIIYKYSFIENDLLHSLDPFKRDIFKSWQNKDLNKEIKVEIGKSFFEDKVQRKDMYVFCKDQDLEKLPIGFDFAKKNIVIFNSSIEEYAAFDEWQNSIYLNENEGIEKIVQSLKGNPEIKIYLRVHPHLKNVNSSQIKDLRRIGSLGFENLQIIWPEEKIDSYALLKNCSKILTFGSTMGVEACFWKKTSILVGRAFYEDLNCSYIPKSHEEVIDLIQKDMDPKPQENAVIYGYWANTSGIEYKYFKPEGDLASGTLIGIDIWKNVSLANRLKHKYLVLKDFGFKNIIKIRLNKLKQKFI
ncbi:TPA: hypothetical protein DEO28_05065 [Candidatus Dependentiae bacterium]|nr:MAG: hypothetical protein UR14_C0002G0126 [candidate division TM6 bacterium GW2011_GWE2_31_21]KKP53923.1 MAG: hypothetical protein UR43_C0002G0126 [candidate division TM6 bacterium GW2011_GWF2_33_332]HBS47703.1 hypothetical protein [Candidatus Dependentiae bacterium]HBZ73852.1 hypothetical protein [Candidatus Dependentiae bacterium]